MHLPSVETFHIASRDTFVYKASTAGFEALDMQVAPLRSAGSSMRFVG